MRRNELREMVKPDFLHRVSMIHWDAARWLQYTGFEWNEKTDYVTFKFKTSTYSIMFLLKTKAFTNLHGEPHIDYESTYEYFRNLKYNDAKRLE